MKLELGTIPVSVGILITKAHNIDHRCEALCICLWDISALRIGYRLEASIVLTNTSSVPLYSHPITTCCEEKCHYRDTNNMERMK